MISGAHCVIYSSDPDADQTFFRDVLALPSVDVNVGRRGPSPTSVSVGRISA
jgi:hypothetical protein